MDINIFVGFEQALKSGTAELDHNFLENEAVAYFSKTFTPSSKELLAKVLGEDRSLKITLIWPRPETYIAKRVDAGESIESSILNWKNITQRVLELYVDYRDQVALVGALPQGAVELANKTDRSTVENLHKLEELFNIWQKPKPISQIIASQVVAEDLEMVDIFLNISASSQAICNANESKVFLSNEVLREGKEKDTHYKSIIDSCNSRISAFEDEVEALKKQLNLLIKEKSEVEKQLYKAQEALEVQFKIMDEKIKVNNTEKFEKFEKEKNEILIHLYKTQEALFDVLDNRIKNEMKDKKAYSEKIESLIVLNLWKKKISLNLSNMAYKTSKKYKNNIKAQEKLLQASKFFDSVWYCKEYKDVSNSIYQPAEHYLRFGALEGRNPSPNFNTYNYLVRNKDVAATGQNPLVHYIKYGQYENRQALGDNNE